MIHPATDERAEAFIRSLFDDLLGDNFSIHAFSFTVDEGSFTDTVDRELAFRSFTSRAVLGMIGKDCPTCATTFIDTYPSGFIGAHALALWFLRFDEDNWFSFARILQKTKAYLTDVPSHDARLELRLFKGFNPRGILTNAICPTDLPIVVNYGAETITLITGELRD